jgi:hypothetical protein
MIAIHLTLCALAAFAFVDGFELAGIGKKYLSKWLSIPEYEIKLKPFDCRQCLAFWLGLAFSLYVGYGFVAIIHGFATTAIAELIYLIYKTLEKYGE